MARAEVVHSDDAVAILLRGNPRRPEPSTAVIKFPGGHVEVTRASDGSYWVHVERNTRINDPESDTLGVIIESRIDHTYEARAKGIPPMPAHSEIQHMAIRIARAGKELTCQVCGANDGRHYGNCRHATRETAIVGPGE